MAAGGSAWGALRAAWGCVGWSWGRGPCGWGKGVEGRWRGRLYQPSSLGIAGPFPGPWRPVLGGRGVPGDGAWHWDVRAPDTVSTPPTGSARALSSGASHPAPSPWVELGSTQVVWCGVVWCGVVWCGVVWCGVVWCGVVWCGVVCPGMVWCGVVWWCGVVSCGVAWRALAWCGGVWCAVLKALLPDGNGRDALHTGNAKREGCVSKRTLCVVCCAPVAKGRRSLQSPYNCRSELQAKRSRPKMPDSIIHKPSDTFECCLAVYHLA